MRHLVGASRPVLDAWTIYFANNKTVGIEIFDTGDWEAALARLCTLDHQGKIAGTELLIHAFYITFDREKTPPISSSITTGKSRPKATVRPLSLYTTTITLESNIHSDSEEDDEGTITEVPRSQGRQSATQKLLAAKTERDKATSARGQLQNDIFTAHFCGLEKCPNAKGACFKHPIFKTHHRISQLEVMSWANQILAKESGVDIKNPPSAWLDEWGKGKNIMAIKTTGKKKLDTKEESRSESVIVNVNGPQSQAPNQYHLYQPPFIPPSYYGFPVYFQPWDMFAAQGPRLPPNPHQQAAQSRVDSLSTGATPVNIPSSPITAKARDYAKDLLEYYDFLIVEEYDSERKQAFRDAITVLQKAQYTLRLVKERLSVDWLEAKGIPMGIAIIVKESISDFKPVFKANRQAEEDA